MTDEPQWQPVTDTERDIIKEMIRLNPDSKWIGMWQAMLHARYVKYSLDGTMWFDNG